MSTFYHSAIFVIAVMSIGRVCVAINISTSIKMQTFVTETLQNQRGEVWSFLMDIIKENLQGCLLTMAVDMVNLNTFQLNLSALWNHVEAGISLIDIRGDGKVSEDFEIFDIPSRGDTSISCQALVLHITNDNSSISIIESFPLLELLPELKLLIIGPYDQTEEILHHPSLHNNLDVIYIADPDLRVNFISNSKLGERFHIKNGQRIKAYRRCLYCLEGEIGIVPWDKWRRQRNLRYNNILLEGDSWGMQGHQLRIVAKALFPYIDYESNTNSDIKVPRDSLDVRILNTIAGLMNFTYEIRAPADGKWGALAAGRWNGIVGELKRGESDLSLRLFWSVSRKQVIDFTRAYNFEPFIMITKAPGLFPQHLAPVRPFEESIWRYIFVSLSVAVLALWTIQRLWAMLFMGQKLSAISAFLQVWRVLLANPPGHLPSYQTARVFFGFWWVFCLLVTSIYRCTMMTFMMVPPKTTPKDTLDQLLAVDGATWGVSGYGIGFDFFKYNSNPNIKGMFKSLQVKSQDQNLHQSMESDHAFFSWKYLLQTVIALKYTDRYGNNPFHFSRQEFMSGQSGWGIRKGAPFLKGIDRIIGRLSEAGLIDQWLWQIIQDAQSKARERQRLQKKESQLQIIDEGGGGQTLTMNHLQGAFYALILGHIMAGFIFGAEEFHAWKNIKGRGVMTRKKY